MKKSSRLPNVSSFKENRGVDILINVFLHKVKKLKLGVLGKFFASKLYSYLFEILKKLLFQIVEKMLGYVVCVIVLTVAGKNGITMKGEYYGRAILSSRRTKTAPHKIKKLLILALNEVFNILLKLHDITFDKCLIVRIRPKEEVIG